MTITISFEMFAFGFIFLAMALTAMYEYLGIASIVTVVATVLATYAVLLKKFSCVQFVVDSDSKNEWIAYSCLLSGG